MFSVTSALSIPSLSVHIGKDLTLNMKYGECISLPTLILGEKGGCFSRSVGTGRGVDIEGRALTGGNNLFYNGQEGTALP